MHLLAIVLFELNNNNTIILETIKTDKEILILNEAIVTPIKAECDNVSPK